jgi:hypothetical protein
MPSKSRRKRGKHSQAKRRKGKLTFAPVTAEQPRASQTQVPVTPSPVAAAAISKPLPKPTTVSYPYVASELKRIGVISAILVAVLIILSRLLS